MRITHQMLSRNYLKRMNTNLTNLTKSNEKMSSQRAYDKGYENVSSAGKALKIRKMIENNERYSGNITDAEGRLAAAEDGLRTVNSLMTRLVDRTVEGLNGTMSPDDRNKIAIELGQVQEEIFQIMNSSYSGKHVYGASGNKDGTAPFTVENGALYYNGSRVDDMQKNPATGKPALNNGGVLEDIPWNEDNYIDIGFGYELKADGKVDYNTAFKDTYSGVECFGYGKNDDGTPLNAWSLVGLIKNGFANNNTEDVDKGLDAISSSMNFMLTSITELGARSVMLEDTQARLDNELVNLLDVQNSLEGIDLSREAINNKDFEMSWLVTLQLGSRILPQTIFDFLR